MKYTKKVFAVVKISEDLVSNVTSMLYYFGELSIVFCYMM